MGKKRVEAFYKVIFLFKMSRISPTFRGDIPILKQTGRETSQEGFNMQNAYILSSTRHPESLISFEINDPFHVHISQ